MKTNHMVLSLCLLFFLPVAAAFGASAYKIAIVSGAAESAGYQDEIVKEINALMEGRGGVSYMVEVIAPGLLERGFEAVSAVVNDDSVDCVIGVDVRISDFLIRLKQYHRPVIAAAVVDSRLQGLKQTPDGASGIRNFNYVEAHFDVEKDLRTFKSLYNYRHIAVLVPRSMAVVFHTLNEYFDQVVKTVSPDAQLSIVMIDTTRIKKGIPEIPPDADAVYLLPLFSQKRQAMMETVIQEVNNRKLPSFALIGEAHVRMGAMAGIAPDSNINAMARRIAINVLDILEGRDAGTLPVSVSTYGDNFVINMATLKEIDCYPSWTAMADAKLVNLDKLHQGPALQLKSVIFEALERNLDYLTAQADTRIQEEEAAIARAELLPQVNVSAGLTRIDENRVEIAQTYPAVTTLSATASLTQTIFSDDTLANCAIQDILVESQRYQEKTSLMDTVVAAARVYINLLFAMSSQTIHNNNLEMTRKNLEIASSKAAVGAVDISEVSRWESEMAANQISRNDAFRDLQLARMALNQVLDRPITREFTLEDVGPASGIELMITDPDVYGLLANAEQVRRFSDFLVIEANRNLPELQQIRETIRSQERRVLNRTRALYLPDVDLQGSVDKVLNEYEARQKTISELDHPWSVTLTASWPLFTGGADKRSLAKSRHQLRRLSLEEKNLKNQLHLNIRSSLETASVSAREIALAQKGLAAALKRFEIVQDGYAQGRNDVADLIDAQNAKVSSERAAASAKYQFVLDFLEMERAMGRFYFLDSPDQKQAFLGRLRAYMETTPIDNFRKE